MPLTQYIDAAHLRSTGFDTLFQVPVGESGFAYLCRSMEATTTPSQTDLHESKVVSIVSTQALSEILDTLTGSLAQGGYSVQFQKSFSPPASDVQATVMLDDFSYPVLGDVSDEQWKGIRDLILKSPCTLWVTQGPAWMPQSVLPMQDSIFQPATQRDNY
ncbi:hypothetical protein BDV06DRAFT_222796 [Aspergillus oleicola]